MLPSFTKQCRLLLPGM